MDNAFKGHTYPKEIIMTTLFIKARFNLSYRDVEEICLIRGLSADHTTIMRWMMKFSPLLMKKFNKRKKPVDGSWRMDAKLLRRKNRERIL